CVLLLASGGCGATRAVSTPPASQSSTSSSRAASARVSEAPREKRSSGSPFFDRLSDAAVARTSHQVRYDPTYYVIDYPNGDVPAEVGVCTDEVSRSYRQVGIDLQREVHEDIKGNFGAYPKLWGLRQPDKNIDHRRVPNLMAFFARKGAGLAVTDDAKDYLPGDVVTWDLGGGLTHIGLVVGFTAESDPQRPLIVHNIGAGPKMEDVLFNWKITGHYRYAGPPQRATPTPAPARR
ncbi:MAG TPA: DUF1287 domain-containing protein, partial [Pyrinomonadaceae bacterium]|nr:DUF1287 domain-containing protein [Pyrinomonadaceae bacterium]